MKARGCVDGRPQREYTDKEEASSPTMSLKVMMMSCPIDAKEGSYVHVTDIPGALLHANMKDTVHMVLKGTITEIIVKLEPTIYRKYVWHNKNESPIYGTLQAALLLLKLLSSALEKWGFTINPYHECVANKILGGKKCTIIWHVDVLKVSHVCKDMVENIIKALNEKFGKESPLVTTWGKVLDYLGMTLVYSSKRKVRLSKFDYVKKNR